MDVTHDVKMNVQGLIDALGGERATAEICGVARTAPYGWARRNFISSTHLATIKAARPMLDLNYFFGHANLNQKPESDAQ